MKRRTVNKVLAAGLTAAMVFSMTACGSKAEETAQIDPEVKNFKIFAGISPLSPDNSEKPLVQQMNEKMGVTIEWNCVSGDTLTEKKNLLLNSGNDLPDALMAAGLSNSTADHIWLKWYAHPSGGLHQRRDDAEPDEDCGEASEPSCGMHDA